MTMKTKPVKRYREPRYPAKLQVLSDPALLRQNMPPGWRTVSPLAGAAALFLSVNATLCRGADKEAGGATMAVVAPIFDHGEGRGADGCIVVSPPVFMSEQEALQVIRQELGKLGVRASQTNFVVPGVKIKPTLGTFERKGDKTEYVPPSMEPLRASAADPSKAVAVQFVSPQNCHRLGAPLSGSTVQHYDLKAVAKSVAEAVRTQSQEKLYFGTFYDPLCRMNLDIGLQTAGSSRAEALRLLRLQVQDFVKWLQAQGAI